MGRYLTKEEREKIKKNKLKEKEIEDYTFQAMRRMQKSRR